MMVQKTSIFPAKRSDVFARLQRLETLQFIAMPYASFAPVDARTDNVWRVGDVSSYQFRLFGVIPFGTHTIQIERFDEDEIQSRESNEHVQVWDHRITLKDLGMQTEYTDEVDIRAGWKTFFVWLWAKAFYAHRQRKWIRLLKEETK
jgi:hypothetical protein